jgi:hypothetical protein
MNCRQSFASSFLVVAVCSAPASARQVATETPGQAARPDAGETGVQDVSEKKPDPFAFADFTWLTGNPRTKESPIDSKVFTGEFRVDTNFTYSFNKPHDDTIVGSSEVFGPASFS